MSRSSATPTLLLAALLVVVVGFGCGQPVSGPPAPPDTSIPVTTSSAEARSRYLEGRSQAEHLRLHAARASYREALRLDPEFSLAWLGIAQTATTTPEAQDALQHAMRRIDELSTGERLLISAFEAGIEDRLETRGELLDDLVRIYPEDARANLQLALHYASLDDAGAALRHAKRASEIDPKFAPAYNVLGYAQMDLQRFDDAQIAFQRYLELLPEQPNPYDSYGEYLLKVGRFDEALASYRHALEIDPGFVFAYVGLGNVFLAMDHLDEARDAFTRLQQAADTVDEKSEALRWIGLSWLHQGDHAGALESIDESYDLAKAAGDRQLMHDTQEMAGEILLAAGAVEDARKRFDLALDVMKLADVPSSVFQSAQRDRRAEDALISLALGAPDDAARHLDDLEASLAGRQRPSETARLHYLRGRTALARGDAEAALAELERADANDPRVLFEIARAREALGMLDKAQEAAYRTAHWNGIDPAWAWVRRPAEAMVERLDAAR